MSNSSKIQTQPPVDDKSISNEQNSAFDGHSIAITPSDQSKVKEASSQEKQIHDAKLAERDAFLKKSEQSLADMSTCLFPTCLSEPNLKMVKALTTTPMNISFDMENSISSGSCNVIYKSTDGRYILKPLPTYTNRSAGVMQRHCALASATVLSQNVQLSYKVADYVSKQFPDNRNPFLEPKFGFSNEGIVGTAFPLIEGFTQFNEIPPHLSEQEWKDAITDLQKIGLTSVLTGQNDINCKNIGFGSDKKIYVVDYDLCYPFDSLELILEAESTPCDPFVELGTIQHPGSVEIICQGISVANEAAKEIFDGDIKKHHESTISKNSKIIEREVLSDITIKNYINPSQIDEFKKKEGDIFENLDMSTKEGIVEALKRISQNEPIASLMRSIEGDEEFAVSQS